MVLQKKLDYGFPGYRVPELPQGSRSIRKKRSSLRKSVDPDRMDAMDLLATVAGMLLVEKGKAPTLSSATSGGQKASVLIDNVNMESLGKGISMKIGQCYQSSCDGGALMGQTTSCSVASGSSSVVKADAGKNGSGEAMVENGAAAATRIEAQMDEDVMGKATTCPPLEDHMDLDTKPQPALVSSDSSVDVPSCRDPISCNHHSSPKFRNDTKLRDQHGDDDENSSGCTHPGPIAPKPFRTQRVGDRRIRKVWFSRFWKVGPSLLKDGEFFSRDVDAKPMFRSRKICCTRQKSHQSPFKRRKLHERSSMSTVKAVEKGIKVEGTDSSLLHGGVGASSFITKPKFSVETEDYQVKLRIKSFKIPELYIEMPENATVGSLKRTVLETVSAMLGNGLRVGLLLQGKKVRDDDRTLLQAGITRGERLESLGFTLEPTPSQAPLQLCPENPDLLHACDFPEPLARLPALTTSDAAVVNAKTDGNEPSCAPATCLNDGDSDLTSSTPNSNALVPVAASADSSALVPQNGKPRRSEVAQRRIRRPFSVTEVEALVQAVEKLGTGRWRDVKLRAFEDAKHRTYVDLKDKWKTLVHTARISPQQRRGEPVPQELLDRVLAAHAYWSQHQANLQVKQQQQQQPKAEHCMLQL